ncbi:hypothetical protein [Ruminococcus sp.]|nr:hypothetical protein [Ruminococcus sp.]
MIKAGVTAPLGAIGCVLCCKRRKREERQNKTGCHSARFSCMPP